MEGIYDLSLNKGYGNNDTESVEASFSNILKQVSVENPCSSVRYGVAFHKAGPCHKVDLSVCGLWFVVDISQFRAL